MYGNSHYGKFENDNNSESIEGGRSKNKKPKKSMVQNFLKTAQNSPSGKQNISIQLSQNNMKVADLRMFRNKKKPVVTMHEKNNSSSK